MNPWAILRLLAWLVLFIGPLFGMGELGIPWDIMPWVAAIAFFGLGAAPLMAATLRRTMDQFAGRASSWKLPSLSTKPFERDSPLQLDWSFSMALIAVGTGALVASGIHGQHVLKYALAWLSAGLGGLLGLAVATRVFRRYFRDDASRP